MTTPMPPTDPPNPDELLPGEAELSAVYRKLPRSEPSAALDAAVLRAAAQAFTTPDGKPLVERRKAPREPGDWVRPKTRSATTTRCIPSIEVAERARRHAPRWLISLASAASLVLVAGLAWHMRQATPEAAAPVVQLETVATAPVLSAPAEAAPAAPRQPADTTHAVAQGADTLSSVAVANDRTRAVRSDQRRSAARPIATRAMTPPPAPPAPAMPPAAAAPAPPAVAEMSAMAAPSADATPAMKSAALPAVSAEGTARQPGDTPAQELDKIQQLFAQKRDDEAHQRLHAFRTAHPQWVLPPALQAQLQDP